MRTPAQEVGLAGQRLTQRVRRALEAIPQSRLEQLLGQIHDLASARHLSYQRDGATETIRLFPLPITLRQDQLGYLHYVSQIILNAIKRLPDYYFADTSVRQILRVTPDEERWLLDCWTPAHREANPVFARLDAVVDFGCERWKDSLQFLEPNLTGIGGIHLAPTSDRVLADLVVPILQAHDPRIRLQLGADIRELLLQDLLEHLEDVGRPTGRIALIDPRYEAEGPDEPEALVRFYRDRHEIAVLHADPSELSLRGGAVCLGSEVIAVGYRDYGVLDLLEVAAEGVDVVPMATLFRENRMISSIAAELDQKSCWEILTDPELVNRHYSPEERLVFRRHIPWTRLLTDRRTTGPDGAVIGLLEHARRHRSSLVIKPNRSYGGEGVTVGPAVDQSAWEEAIDVALADTDRWVVQQLAEIPVQEFAVLGSDGRAHVEPYFVVMGFVPSRYGVGLVARASQQRVVNVAQHGGECAVLVSSSVVGSP